GDTCSGLGRHRRLPGKIFRKLRLVRGHCCRRALDRKIQPAWHFSGGHGSFVAARRACASETGKRLLPRKWAGDSCWALDSAELAALEVAVLPVRTWTQRNQTWIVFPQCETKRGFRSLYRRRVAAHRV